MDGKTNNYIIDFKNVKSVYDMFEIISKAMSFPDYFGNNWDAFWDCITDINCVPLNIEIYNFNILKEKLFEEAQCLMSCLKQLKNYADGEYYEITNIKVQDGEKIYYIE